MAYMAPSSFDMMNPAPVLIRYSVLVGVGRDAARHIVAESSRAISHPTTRMIASLHANLRYARPANLPSFANPVVIAKPVDEAAHAHFDRRVRAVTDGVGEFADIGEGV